MADSENLELAGDGPEAARSPAASAGASELAPTSKSTPPAEPPSGADSGEEWARRRRRDKIGGLGIVAVTFGLCLLLSLWAKQASRPPSSPDPAPPTTVGLEGFPNRIDPLTVLPLARGLTDRPLFRGFVADRVQPNGLLDFSKKATRLRFSFQSLPGQGAQPNLPPGTLPSRAYCGHQNVTVTAAGIVAEPDKPNFPCPSDTPQALPAPKCRLDALWKLAKKKGVPTKRSARIEYYESKKGPAYRFSIAGTKHRFVVGEDCKRELKAKDAVGSVP